MCRDLFFGAKRFFTGTATAVRHSRSDASQLAPARAGRKRIPSYVLCCYSEASRNIDVVEIRERAAACAGAR